MHGNRSALVYRRNLIDITKKLDEFTLVLQVICCRGMIVMV
jgi:hypothetical protein